jgi:hypothetical protein
MNIDNIRGEQEILGGIIKIFARHPVTEYNSVDKQERYVKILHSKLHKDNIFRQDMEALPKADTVKEWIANFKRVREKGRQIIQSSLRYGAQPPPTEHSYKGQSKRQPQGDSFKNETKKRLQQKMLKDSNDTEKRTADWSKPHCDTCGMPGHDTAKCWLDNPPAHSDRNIETITFELSTKGKQWIHHPKGPFCLARWYLNGNPRVPVVIQKTNQPTQQSKLLTTMLTTVLDKIKLNKTSHSDYLSI